MRYHSDGNGWTAAVIDHERKDGRTGRDQLVGVIDGARTGMRVTAYGDWTTHRKYGRQFKADAVIESRPATAEGLEGYLASGGIKGVGPETARRIVEKFGADTADVIENSPERLREVNGVGAARAARISESWKKKNALRDICITLGGYGIGFSCANRIYAAYGARSVGVLKNDPYRIADEVWGFGFRTADEIAMKMGMKPGDAIRVRSGARYVLGEMRDGGHCFATREQLAERTEELLSGAEGAEGIDDWGGRIADSVDGAPRSMFVKERDRVYLPYLYEAEKNCAGDLARILRSGRAPVKEQRAAGITYDETQEKAIKTALGRGCCFITGGPGTGKTTIARTIVASFMAAGQDVRLAAPTGRAAKRLSEATGRPAQTIHRLLEVGSDGKFKKNAGDRLSGDALIVDECSMLDVALAASLFAAVPDGMRLILIGDADQLPSVGPGDVFRDIMRSGMVPGVKLSYVHRQEAGSRIAENAHRINLGSMPENKNGGGYWAFAAEDDEKAADAIITFCAKHIPEKFGKDEDVQVLSPMKRGECGTWRLNERLQEALNPGAGGVHCGRYVIRAGDRVMQTKNNYGLGVYNGDIGTVTEVGVTDGTAEIDMDGRPVHYEEGDLENVALAYAATVHKAQGSEYGTVVMPLVTGHYVMLNRNLLYTALTRAKDNFIVVGQEKAMRMAVKNEEVRKRQTTLALRIAEACGAGEGNT